MRRGAFRSGNMDKCGCGRGPARIASRASIPAVPEGIDMWAAAREIAKAVPEAKPAEEEPAQTRGPKH